MSNTKHGPELFVFIILSAIFIPFHAWSLNNSETEQIAAAEKLVEEKKFREALDRFTSLFESGAYNEKMLYQMAYLHELAGEYPAAIFCLKKIRKEFGGDLLDQKVTELIKKNGGQSYMSADPWEDYFVYFNRFYWLIWGLFAAGSAYTVWYFLKKKKITETAGRQILIRLSLFVFVASALLIGHRLFLSPELAVITRPTSFYLEPAYGSGNKPNALAEGETVRIVDSHDIWVKVQAGEKKFWVPRHVVKNL